MGNYTQLITRLEYAIFGSPSQATGIDGWMKHGNTMQTRCRPDGSVSPRPDKTVLKFIDDALFLTYNGASFKSAYVRGLLKRKFGDDWLKITCKLYGITNDFSDTDTTPQDFHKQTDSKPKPYEIGDENNVDCIPQTIVSMTYDRTRPDVLRQYLCSVFGEAATLQAWERYRVGDAFGGQTIWWNYDRQGRCRGGKMMAYRPDGHRDKEDKDGNENKYSIISVGYDLKRLGHISEDTEKRLIPCLFGEHLLEAYPLAPVGLVESEKTAVIMSIVAPKAIWIATGGATQNLNRVVAILKGRKVTIFPDADAVSDWKNRFGFGKVRGFTVNEICRDYFRKNGVKWAKADLADIVTEEYRQKSITA